MYVILLRNVCLIIALSTLLLIGECRKPRIVGGKVNEKNYPFMVSLRCQRFHICGGSIINARTVVTAAHCVHKLSARVLSVHVGENTLQVIEGQVHDVERLHYHDMWNCTTYDYDVGLIRIKDSFNFGSLVQPIKLVGPIATIPDESLATILGWGSAHASSNQSVEYLREAQVPVFNQNECSRIYDLVDRVVTERMLCAGYKHGGTDACSYDSGGPLIANETLIGIVSWGYECAQPDKPGVYARLSVLRPWIDNVLLKEYNEIL